MGIVWFARRRQLGEQVEVAADLCGYAARARGPLRAMSAGSAATAQPVSGLSR